ncbi:MAG: hypothetical protein KAT68_17370, partial [Bacteroidales bacterium]|nr:hypothetical protein [Bacteroidales bacterium]
GEVIFNDDTHIGQDDAAENLEIHDGGTFKMWDLSDDTSITFDVDDGTTELDLTGSLEVSVDIKLLGGNLTISDGTDTAQISMIQETGLGERLTICVDEDSRTVVICDIGDINTDFGLTAAAEPRLVFIDAGGTEKAEIYKSQYLFAIRNFDDNIALYGRGVTNYMNADREAANVFSFESETIHYELTDTDGEQSWIYVGARIDQSLTAAANILKLEMAEEVLGDGTTGLGNNWILCENVSGDAEFKIDLSGEVSTYGNSANAAFTMLNLINTDEQSTTETGQTSDLEFKVQGTIDSGSNYTDEEAFKISAIKTSDYFHAADQTDNDSKVEFSPVTDGSYVVAMTLEDNDATIADDCDVVGDFTAGTIASDAGLSGTTLALTAGITQSPTATGNLYDLQLENEWTNGVVMIGNYGSATTLSGDIAGIYFDFETQITSVNKDIDGFKIKLPAQTNTGDDPYASTGYSVSGGALDMSAGAGSTTWKGLDVTMPNITETAGTVNSYGVYIAGGTVTSGTEYGIYVNSADSYFGGDVTSTNTVQAEQLTSTDDALIKDALTLGDDVNNTSGTLNWIASDADAGSFAIGTSDNFAVTGFTGGFDIDGDCTVGTLISDAGVGGTTGTFSSTLSAGNTFTQETYVIRKHVAITGAADNAATNFFTITTTDETGDVDGGGYTVNLYVMAGESLANNSTNTAIMSMTCHFGRIMVGAGTGTNSAVAEISQSASAGEGTGAIANVTITVVETSEFIQTVQVTVDINGGTADATAIVELIYSDFTTSPVIAGI